MSATVVIVDDSLTVRMDLVEAFGEAGFDTFACTCIAEARETLARERTDVVVLDVVLPDGDGVELLRELREGGGPPVAVLMLSSEAEVKDRVRGLKTGADEYVGKPYDTAHVVARARELVRANTQASGVVAPTILVIDDSATVRESLREHLTAEGFTVVTAASGEEGLQVAAVTRPAAIIVDATLPGIDGSTVIRRVRLDTALRRVPCLLLTGDSEHGAELRALDAGADAFVRKDDGFDVLHARLVATLRRVEGEVSSDASSTLGPFKVLAVDDNDDFLEMLAETLRVDGYDVAFAHSGVEALELLAVQAVDCILLDLMMPGLDGHETCRRIKAAPVMRDIPLIVLTGLDDREATLESLGSGADDCIGKATEPAVLRARVRAQIRRKRFEDENRRIREDLLRTEIEATEARAAQELAETRRMLVEELELKNNELEAFSYSVSHDLRAPLRSIDGFSEALLEDYSAVLDDRGRDYLRRVRAASTRMAELIDDLLLLSRVTRADLNREALDLAVIARHVFAELVRREPERNVELVVAKELPAVGDPRLLQVALENLLGNAWKFTRERPAAHLEVGFSREGDEPAYYVRDDGAGFDMTYAARLFRPFQRLNPESRFPGTGIGLATIQRIVSRHGGRVWAEGTPGQGAAFWFTLPDRPGARP
jgi:DNA-binding response OmpR family regulator